MTFKVSFRKVNLLLVIALLAALLLPVMAAVSGQAIASIELFDSDSAENARIGSEPATIIACSCGDPGGSGGSCC